jgi:hypothetical protein
MNIFFEVLRDDKHMRALILLANNGDFFYAEPINEGVIGEGLEFNDYMFHFESNEDRTKIKLKDSKQYITDAITGWLANCGKINFIHLGKDEVSWGMLKDISQMTDEVYSECSDEIEAEYISEVGGTEKTIVEKTYLLKEIYDKVNKDKGK